MSTGRALSLLLAPALAACGEPAPICDNKVKREAVSPDGALKATLFQRDCGPLTGASSQVSVLGVNETGTAKGNALIADTSGGLAPAAEWGGPDIGLEWTSPTALTLTYPFRARIITCEPVVAGVTVTCKFGD
jgi:hypothetical protein